MGIKRQAWTDNKNSRATETTSGLNRRQFLRRIGVSAGTAVLASQGISQALLPIVSTYALRERTHSVLAIFKTLPLGQ